MDDVVIEFVNDEMLQFPKVFPSVAFCRAEKNEVVAQHFTECLSLLAINQSINQSINEPFLADEWIMTLPIF